MSVAANSPITNAWAGSQPLTLERGIAPKDVHSNVVLAGLLGRRLRVTDRELDIYVDPLTGNDNNEGQVSARPVATLQRAAELLPEVLMHQVRVHVVSSVTLADDCNFACLCLDQGQLFITGGFANTTQVLAEQTPTASTTSTLTVNAAGWTVDAYRGRLIEFTDGALVGKRYMILGNTADTITLNFTDASIDTDNAGAGPKFKIVTPSTIVTSTGKTIYINAADGNYSAGAAPSLYLSNITTAGTTTVFIRGAAPVVAGVCYSSTSSTAFWLDDCKQGGFGGTIPSDDGTATFGLNGICGLGYIGAVSGNNGRIALARNTSTTIQGSVIPFFLDATGAALLGTHLVISGSRILSAQSISDVTTGLLGNSGLQTNTRFASLTLNHCNFDMGVCTVDGATLHAIVVAEGSVLKITGVVSGTNVSATGLGIQVQDLSQLHLYAVPTVNCDAGVEGAGFDGAAEAAAYATLAAAGTVTPNTGAGLDNSIIVGHV